MAVLREDFDRRVVKKEIGAVAFREVVFKSVGGHVGFAAPVNDHDFRAEPARLSGGVDRGVAATDHGDTRANRNLMQRLGVDLLDESERFDDFGKIFAGNAQPLAFAETDPDEDRVEVALKFGAQRHLSRPLRRNEILRLTTSPARPPRG